MPCWLGRGVVGVGGWGAGVHVLRGMLAELRRCESPQTQIPQPAPHVTPCSKAEVLRGNAICSETLSQLSSGD